MSRRLNTISLPITAQHYLIFFSTLKPCRTGLAEMGINVNLLERDAFRADSIP